MHDSVLFVVVYPHPTGLVCTSAPKMVSEAKCSSNVSKLRTVFSIIKIVVISFVILNI